MNASHRPPTDRTHGVLLAVLFTAIAALLVAFAAFGHPPVRAAASSTAVSSLAGGVAQEPLGVTVSDPSVPAAAEILRHTSVVAGEDAPTF